MKINVLKKLIKKRFPCWFREKKTTILKKDLSTVLERKRRKMRINGSSSISKKKTILVIKGAHGFAIILSKGTSLKKFKNS